MEKIVINKKYVMPDDKELIYIHTGNYKEIYGYYTTVIMPEFKKYFRKEYLGLCYVSATDLIEI